MRAWEAETRKKREAPKTECTNSGPTSLFFISVRALPLTKSVAYVRYTYE